MRDSLAVERVGELFLARIVHGADGGEPHGPAVVGVGVAGRAGVGADDLFKDQDGSGLQGGQRALERGGSGSSGKAAARVLPGIEVHLILLGLGPRVLHGGEADGAGEQNGGLRRAGSDDRGKSGNARENQCAGGEKYRIRDALGELDVDPGAGVVALVHLVIDQLGVAAGGDAAARGAEIGLRADGVLLVTEVVGEVGLRLNQGDADVGLVRFGPGGREHRHAVQHHLAEGGKILGEVVDVGLDRGRRRAAVVGRAIGDGGAAGFEGEGDGRELGIEARGRVGGVGRGDKRERVGGKIAGVVQIDSHDFGRVRGSGFNRFDAHPGRGGDSPRDLNLIRCERDAARILQHGEQKLLAAVRAPRHHFEIVDAVERRVLQHQCPAVLVGAEVDHAEAPP